MPDDAGGAGKVAHGRDSGVVGGSAQPGTGGMKAPFDASADAAADSGTSQTCDQGGTNGSCQCDETKCAPHQSCAGTTAMACSCDSPPSACSGGALTTCVNNTLNVCLTDAQSCVYLASQTACPTGRSCSGNACVCDAEPNCPDGAGTTCVSGKLRTCATNAEGCVVWAEDTACSAAQTCSAGSCQCDEAMCGAHQSCGSTTATACTCDTVPTACSSGAATTCSNDIVSVCQADAQSCVFLSSQTPCAPGKPCSGNTCVCDVDPNCPSGAGTTCVAGRVRTCAVNAQGCVVWMGDTACGSVQGCVTTGTTTAQCQCDDALCPTREHCQTLTGNSCVCNTAPAACPSHCTSDTLTLCATDANGCTYVSSQTACAVRMSCSGLACACDANASCPGNLAGSSCPDLSTRATCTVDSNQCAFLATSSSCSWPQRCGGASPSSSCRTPTSVGFPGDGLSQATFPTGSMFAYRVFVGSATTLVGFGVTTRAATNTGTANDAIFAIYADSTGPTGPTPGALLGKSGTVTMPTAAGNPQLQIATETPLASGWYWLAWVYRVDRSTAGASPSIFQAFRAATWPLVPDPFNQGGVTVTVQTSAFTPNVYFMVVP